MKQTSRSKSSLFLMELLINLLLFCVLCGFTLLFFIKSRHLSENATTLQQAVSITSSIAGIYETGDGTLQSIQKYYKNAEFTDDSLTILFDQYYAPCTEETFHYRVNVQRIAATTNRIRIDFFDQENTLNYSISTSYHQPATPLTGKEVSEP